MKVLHVTCSFDLGGSQRQLMQILEAQSRRRFDHEVREIFPEQNVLFRRGQKFGGEEQERCRWPERGLERLLSSPSVRSLQSLQILQIWAGIRRIKPTIVLGWGHELALLTAVAGGLAGVPRIAFNIRSLHESIHPAWHESLRQAHRRWAPLADFLIGNSSLVARDYAEWAGVPGRMHVVPNGVQVPDISDLNREKARLQFRRCYGIPEDAVLISFLGRLSPEKGVDRLWRAFRQLRQEFPGLRLALCVSGTGPLFSALKAELTHEDRSRVFLTGSLEDPGPLFCASDLFVMPSDFEGQPNSLMEAMAYGCPCISTPQSGIVDLARSGEHLLIVPDLSAGALREGMAHLLQDQVLMAKLGHAARERMKCFSIPASLQLLEDAFPSV